MRFATTAEAVRSGVAVVSQELNLFGDLDVLANLFTMREIRRGPFISRREMARAGAAGAAPSSGSTCGCARASRSCRSPSAS